MLTRGKCILLTKTSIERKGDLDNWFSVIVLGDWPFDRLHQLSGFDDLILHNFFDNLAWFNVSFDISARILTLS